MPLRPEWAARLAERSLMLFDLIEPVLGDKSRTRLQADRKTMVDLQRRAASA